MIQYKNCMRLCTLAFIAGIFIGPLLGRITTSIQSHIIFHDDLSDTAFAGHVGLETMGERRIYHETIINIASKRETLDIIQSSNASSTCFKTLTPDYEDSCGHKLFVYREAFAYYICAFKTIDEFTRRVSEVLYPYNQIDAIEFAKNITAIAMVEINMPTINSIDTKPQCDDTDKYDERV